MAVIPRLNVTSQPLNVGPAEHEGSRLPADSYTVFHIQPHSFATVNTTALGVNQRIPCSCFISDFQVVVSETPCSAFRARCELRNARHQLGLRRGTPAAAVLLCHASSFAFLVCGLHT